MNHDTSMKRAMHFNATVHVSIMFIRQGWDISHKYSELKMV